ncbi:LamG-like jellyroll fold domain-containing protein [Lutibacter sp. TH_r2]|uniref:LamG-like jellyroll fold domain-containing protein n=1 Tax=Lutibacter sp. TH_r2 TaxID=3082083 RepID=UPI002952B1E9|nr:LamG-like jellyroll fold domain-containing protein [Lutibacter sp. TH_r2]MDV7185699.1 LamG-like jellyroll fold domain-containing protein [Lutibacter sp. TH_r2]
MMKKLLFAILLISYSLNAQTIYVDQNATGSNNGIDWANAYTNLQTAITNIGSNTSINVAQGTYYPTTTSDRSIYFNIPNGVKIYGGFPTNGGTRDSELHPTILSGDIGVIDDNTDNSYHVVYFLNTVSSTEIDGFIIEKGYANGTETNESNGGGILISTVDYGDSNAYIRNCIIRDNYASGEGGGIYVSKRAEIYNCKIYSNQSNNNGGGISISTNGRIYNSYIVNNKSVNFGGGIKITGINSAPKAINCVIANNECEYYGAGAYLAEGYLNNCTIVNNGGNGIHFGSYGSTFNGLIWGNSTYQSTHVVSSTAHLVENNCIQDIATTAINIGISTNNNGVIYGENYPRFTKPTSFTGIATTPEQLDEILNADWSLNPQSAAIDFGDNSSYPTTTDTPTVDIIGNNRTINTIMDAGAYEAITNLTTNQATNQQSTSANLNGNILFAETTNTIERGFVYANESNFDITTATSLTNSATDLGVYSDNISGLTEGKFYYYRAWAEIDGVKYYANEQKFNTSNLEAYYPFNGNANDESGNENHGTVNGATLTQDMNGNENNAYLFDGIDDTIICQAAGPVGESPRTITFWAKTDEIPYSTWDNAVISYGSNDSYGNRFELSVNSRAQGLGADINGAACTKGFDNTDNDWHFYSAVFDPSIGKTVQLIQLYADGILLTTLSYNNGDTSLINTASDIPIHIGSMFNTHRFFNGSIDNLRVYSSILTESDIIALYNTGVLDVKKNSKNEETSFYISNNTLHFKSIQNLNDIKSIEVYNLLGQKVFETSKIEEEIKLENLRVGIYIARVNSENGYQTLKFINR